MVSRVFYEASRDLDSPPSPRANHVEACRPRGCFVCIQCSGGPAVLAESGVASDTEVVLPSGTVAACPPWPDRKGRGSGPFEEPVPSGLGRLSGWRGLTPLRPRSCGSVPRRREPSHCWSGKQRAGELLSAPCGEKLPGRARSRGPAAARACASASSRAANALGSTYRRCHNGGYGRP